ncbi:sensor histidine kinase [Tuwongella immobilis]|uniref:histidine kinase n=1 Tax=Tuwongella immobilis TaxID=692036 RepID=A0A6C2YQ91_9BACT|nr:ATP-binding protein [Tuwongella immobilis]VIP03800.1 histidine kinase : Histidine kinase OS=Singulisphaera acidiphila (strain ATCC BAA-1392 / DSM 18658 / VKM B-2454 / MOB10) GN=Sinac_0783 PE=4 SV=1: HisKA: HATPase_c [Tuwongella immobilis]VTS04967.1 histidine kinase : Histidine kinase OS=Singulisphaera acidiphila (strain ATCC BAA-1392 / DSM 18658 / VKM B-2454 / MOB10) GN=Sinac_0783 PE=4 SV=1: HisKA: HATPase_c [Tuwongella immobilis]
MEARTILRLIAPTILVGVLLFWGASISRDSLEWFHEQLVEVIDEKTVNLVNAQQLEIAMRQLRIHSLLLAMRPNSDIRTDVENDHLLFETALRDLRSGTSSPEESHILDQIEIGYMTYRQAVQRESNWPVGDSRAALEAWAFAHPVRHLAVPCQALLTKTRAEMERVSQSAQQLRDETAHRFWLLAVIGPSLGIFAGWWLGRGVSRSITRLRIGMHDISAQMDRDIGAIQFRGSTKPTEIEAQLPTILERIRTMVQQLQDHERERVRSEQLAAVGQLAANVAHEIRNPLTSMQLLIGVAIKQGDPSALTLDDLGVIHREIGRLERTVQGLLGYARVPPLQRRRANLEELIHERLHLHQARAQSQGIAIEFDSTVGNPELLLDVGQIGGMLSNLILNAFDAMPTGGRLSISLHPVDSKLELTIRDSGRGFSQAIMPRIFQPFTTTKATGTGLGLSMAKQVVTAHGGEIFAGNHPQGGAEIRVRWPLLQE